MWKKWKKRRQQKKERMPVNLIDKNKVIGKATSNKPMLCRLLGKGAVFSFHLFGKCFIVIGVFVDSTSKQTIKISKYVISQIYAFPKNKNPWPTFASNL